MSEPDRNKNQLADSVRRRQERQKKWEREGERPLAQNLALIGTFGWLIVVPTLGGLFIGRWLDHMFESGIFWTASLLWLGLAIGCWLAWKRLRQEG